MYGVQRLWKGVVWPMAISFGNRLAECLQVEFGGVVKAGGVGLLVEW